MRRLPAYNVDDEESTARHDVPPRIIVENHTHLHSEHELEVPELPAIKGMPTLTKALVAGAGLLASAIVAYVASKLGAH